MGAFDINSNFNKSANFTQIKFGEQKPVLEVELNEMQEIQNEARADLIRDSIPSGFIQLSDYDYTYMSTNPNSIKFTTRDSIAYVNGYKITIPSGTVVTLNAPPTQTPREDLVFLEVWKEEIDYTETVTTGGKDGGTALTNYLKDSRVNVESTRRVQLKWRIRVVDGVDFTKYTEGLGTTYNSGSGATTTVNVQGGLTSPLVTSNWSYWFRRNGNLYSDTNGTIGSSSFSYCNDNGLYVAGIGDSASKTALNTVDGYVYAIPMFRVYRRPSCGYMESNEYLKISPLSSAQLVGGKTSQSKVAHTGITGGVSTKIEGRTLVNLLADNGNLGDISKFVVFGGTTDTSLYYTGSKSTKFVFSASNGSTEFDLNGLDSTHKYFCSSYVYLSSYTSGGVKLQCTDYGGMLNPVFTTTTNTKLTQWQRISLTFTGKTGTKIYVGTSTTSTLTANVDGVVLYDLTAIYGAGSEPSDIPTLERQLPYLSGGMKTVQPISLKTTSKNLINKADIVQGSFSGANFVDATNRLRTNTHIQVSPNTTYTVSYTGTSLHTSIVLREYDDNKVLIKDNGWVSPTFTIRPNTRFIRIMVKKSDDSTIVPSDLTTIQLEIGGTATTYEDYTGSESVVNLPTNIDLKQIGSIKDKVDLQTGDYTKNISDIVTLDGSWSWGVYSNGSAFKTFNANVLDSSLVNRVGTVIKYNGNQLVSGNLQFSSPDYFSMREGNSYIYMSMSNSDTGFSDSYTPSANEIKAYFNGWKMCQSDGTSPYIPSLVPYTPSTWSEWSSAGTVTKDSTGMTITCADAGQSLAYMDVNAKPSTKYGVLVNIVSNTLNTKNIIIDTYICGGYALFSPGDTGNKKLVFTTNSSITTNRFRLIQTSSGEGGTAVKFKDIRVFELPPGSQIESDFNNLTADQLAGAYGFYGLCTKYWKKIGDGSGGTSTLPTSSYVGYNPYKMIYQLATPVVTNIKDKIEGRNYYNVGYNGIQVDQVSSIECTPTPITDILSGIGGCELDDNSDGIANGWVAANYQTPSIVSSPNLNGNCQKLFPTSPLSESGLGKDISAGATGDKVYLCFMGRTNNISNFVSQKINRYATGGYTNGEALLTQSIVANDTWYKASVICTWDSTKTRVLFGSRATTSSTTDYILIDNIVVINLTSLFGSGYEPSQAWCDKYLDFGTNYYLTAPTNTTALRVTNDYGARLDSVYANIGIISASKYRSGLYKLYYRQASGDYVFPDVTITCGTQTATLTNNANAGSITLADTDVPYKKHSDGAISINAKVVNLGTINISSGETRDVSVSSDVYNTVLVGENYVNPLYTSQFNIVVLDKLGNNTLRLKNFGNSNITAFLANKTDRKDCLYSDIVIPEKDIKDDLRHLVSLTGFNYQEILAENFDKLLRNEL